MANSSQLNTAGYQFVLAEPERELVLTGVVLDAAAARKLARDEAYRSTPEAAMFRAFSGG